MNYYFAVYECDENGDEIDHLKNFKSEEKAIVYCDKLDFNSHVVIMPPPGFDDENMEEWNSDYEPYEVIYDNFEKVRNNSKKRRGNTPYTNYMRDIFPNKDNEEEWEKWRRDCVNFFNKWQDTCIENHVRVYDLIDYLVNAICEILNINKQDRRGLWDVDKCCCYLMFGSHINSAAYKELLNAHSTNDIDNVIKKYGKTAKDYNGLLSIKNSVIKSSISFPKNDFEEFSDDLSEWRHSIPSYDPFEVVYEHYSDKQKNISLKSAFPGENPRDEYLKMMGRNMRENQAALTQGEFDDAMDNNGYFIRGFYKWSPDSHNWGCEVDVNLYLVVSYATDGGGVHIYLIDTSSGKKEMVDKRYVQSLDYNDVVQECINLGESIGEDFTEFFE